MKMAGQWRGSLKVSHGMVQFYFGSAILPRNEPFTRIRLIKERDNSNEDGYLFWLSFEKADSFNMDINVCVCVCVCGVLCII